MTESSTATGRRTTRQQRAVAAVLGGSAGFLSAQDIHSKLRQQGEGVGLATVYRALQGLVDAGDADVLRTSNGEAIYRGCSTGHHHHLVCRECGATVEVSGPAVERWAHKVAEENGFSDVSHVLELFGTCADCRG